MQTQQEVANALAKIRDEELLDAAEASLVKSGYQALKQVRFDGLVLRAPAHVELRTHTSVPTLVAMSLGAERADQVPLPDNAALLVTRLGSGERWVVPAFPPPEGKIPLPPSRRPKPPPPANPTMRVTGVKRLDLIELKALPREPGRYAVRILAWDWQSNTVVITLAEGGAVPGPAQARLLSRPPSVPEAVLDFFSNQEKPMLEGRGVALSLPTAPVKEGTPLLVRVALRLKAEAGWPRTADGATVIPSHVVLTRRGRVMPLILELPIALPADREVVPGSEVEASFSVDLDRLASSPLPAADYQVYLVAGESVSAPVSLQRGP